MTILGFGDFLLPLLPQAIPALRMVGKRGVERYKSDPETQGHPRVCRRSPGRCLGREAEVQEEGHLRKQPRKRPPGPLPLYDVGAVPVPFVDVLFHLEVEVGATSEDFLAKALRTLSSFIGRASRTPDMRVLFES